MNDENLAERDLALGARQLVVDMALRVLIEQAITNDLAVGDRIAKKVDEYLNGLDSQSELERDFAGKAKAYVALLLHPASS